MGMMGGFGGGGFGGGGGGFGGGPGGPGRGRMDEEIDVSQLDTRSIFRFTRYVKPYVWYIVLAVALMLVASGAGLVGPYLMQQAIDNFITNGKLATAARLSGLTRIVAFYVAIYVINWLATYWQTYVISWAGQRIIFSVRKDLFGHLQRLGLKFYDRLEAGRIMSRVTNDVEAVNQLLSSGLVSLLNDLFTIFGIMAIMLTMNWRLALAAFITVPLLMICSNYFQRRMRSAYHRVRRRIADVNANLQESISGIRVTQSFTRENVNMDRFEDTNQGNMQANLEAAALNSAFFPLVDFIGALGTTIVLWAGGYLIVTAATGGTLGQGLTLGILVAFLNYVSRFFMPIRDLSQLYNTLQSAIVSTERIFEFFDEVPDVQSAPAAPALPPIVGAVRFNDITFGYTDDKMVLRGVNIVADPGQTIALVGPTGAGKSTVINLLTRFYDPQQGNVTIDGHDLRTVTLKSLRRQLGIVLQDTFLFSGTIRDNIRYGKPEATEEEVCEAARTVNAHEFIMALPKGYDTEVQERGNKLSVGQRQLISFARALLADPKILILDEATSSVDAYTEVLIQRALERLLANRTAFVIAHRLSTIRNADRIYVIDAGQVVESGTHGELLAREGGRYRDLYEKQFAAETAGLAATQTAATATPTRRPKPATEGAR